MRMMKTASNAQAGRSQEAKPWAQRAERTILLTGTPATSTPQGALHSGASSKPFAPEPMFLCLEYVLLSLRSELPAESLSNFVCITIRCQGGAHACRSSGLLPKAKVTFTKFGERYCLSASYHPKAYYGSKYDGENAVQC